MSAAIEESILNYNKVLVSVLEQVKKVSSNYACVNPEDVRNSYDTIHGIIETKITEINKRKEYIKKCIKDLEECNKLIAEMEKVLKEIGETSNKGRVGTLFALCKQTIKENDITMDEIEKMVSDFPYDEQNEIKKYKEQNDNNDNNINGGKNKFSKRNNTKRKNYRAKNCNNKSKKRRFKSKKV
jgi:hypothetical protein